MRIDFHFYTIYVLARAAGFSPDNAYVIAYASQYTDDEVKEGTIYFENGGEFTPSITAHRIFDPHTVSEEICKRVWMPFHFLPGNLGVGQEQLLTRANSPTVQEIISQFLRYDLLPSSLHLLGIILHAYADTWSHQNFLGMIDGTNRVSELRVNGKDVWKYKIAPPLGHAQTGGTPDEPRLEWEYRDYQEVPHHVVNYHRALEAAQNCHTVLSRFIDKFADDFRDSMSIPWQQIEEKIMNLFQYQADEKGCVEAWAEAISSGELGFNSHGKDINLMYDPGEWFNIAIRTDSRMNQESGQFMEYYYKNDNLESSDLNYFNDAAEFYFTTLFIKNTEKLGLTIGLG